jgi:hypothetical protein
MYSFLRKLARSFQGSDVVLVAVNSRRGRRHPCDQIIRGTAGTRWNSIEPGYSECNVSKRQPCRRTSKPCFGKIETAEVGTFWTPQSVILSVRVKLGSHPITLYKITKLIDRTSKRS